MRAEGSPSVILGGPFSRKGAQERGPQKRYFNFSEVTQENAEYEQEKEKKKKNEEEKGN